MRRALLALAVLLTASASPALAGYVIVRVLLEGGAPPTDQNAPGTTGSPPGAPPGISSRPVGPGGMPMNPTAPGAPGAAPAAEADPSRSVVVVVPVEGNFAAKHLDPKKTYYNPADNPFFKQVRVPLNGKVLHASLFIDSSTIQLYDKLIAKPAPRQTVATEVYVKYEQWRHDKKDAQILYDAMMMALRDGIIREPVPLLLAKQAPPAMAMAQELLDLAAEKKVSLPADAEKFVRAWGQMSKDVKKRVESGDEVESWKNRLDATAARVDGHYALVYWDRDTGPEEIARRAGQLNDNFDAFFLWHAARGIVLPVPDKPLLVVLARQGQAVHQLQQALDGMPKQTDAFYAPDHRLLVLSPEPLDDVAQTFLRQNQQLFNKGFSRTGLLNLQIPKLDATGEKGSRPEDVARASTLALVEKLMLEESEVAAISHEGTRQLMFATGELPRNVTLPTWLTTGAANAFTRPRGPAFVTAGEDDKPFMCVALATGYGSPNYVLQRYFNEMGDRYHKELNADPAKLLEHVLTDAYFAGIKTGIDPDPLPPPKKRKKPAAANPAGAPGSAPGTPPGAGPTGRPPGYPPGAGPTTGPGFDGMPPAPDEEDPVSLLRQKRARLAIKANATAWALYYYLANARPNELKTYLAELNKLPRDLPIDGKTAHAAFVRVFGLSATKDGPADPARVAQFAKGWLSYIATVPAAGYDVPIDTPEPPKTNTNGPMGPKGPFGPGGPPMAGTRPGSP